MYEDLGRRGGGGGGGRGGGGGGRPGGGGRHGGHGHHHGHRRGWRGGGFGPGWGGPWWDGGSELVVVDGCDPVPAWIMALPPVQRADAYYRWCGRVPPHWLGLGDGLDLETAKKYALPIAVVGVAAYFLFFRKGRRGHRGAGPFRRRYGRRNP